ncbi:MoxR family ATPase [Terrimonas sp.]|uniref:AAA family ATPase n=1 Tax=Terrimonas sp. TaxID=1914338 RepID=UPI000D520347|nr:MoxR family ATPase [Terrimonas sp.]PVD54029.1 MoxR family ATPase [Terrimonas sp.]
MFTIKNIQVSSANRPDDYVIHDHELTEAVNMSIWLQKPLLLTGAPGTGKTQLAFKVAQELGKAPALNGFAPFLSTPFVFNTKTTSAASDLFYYYDAVGHFQKRNIINTAAQENKGTVEEITPHSFIQLNALGEAIIQSFGKDAILGNEDLQALSRLNGFNKSIQNKPASSVVLIDEIDKAPRDFPNDLLNEIEHYEFKIQELNKQIAKDKSQKPFPAIVVIMTSNFEKNLPDAFLRRCLFYHIPSPGKESLYKIVSSRMAPYLKELYAENALTDEELAKKMKGFDKAVDQFYILKDRFKDKKPATSELLEWIKVLELNNFFTGDVDFTNLPEDKKTILRYSIPILAKTKDDMEMIRKEL